MAFLKTPIVEKLDVDVNTSEVNTANSARLVFVNGKGKLLTHTTIIKDSYYGYRYLKQIKLNGIPLVQINSPGCPTCSSLLATGYGITKANCKELSDTCDDINSSYISLDASIKTLEPLLGLLKTSLYIIADAICYPTDGNGAFFWDVPNEPTENQATAGIILPDADYDYVSGQPVYLYPTQTSDCYNEERVQHYIKIFKNSNNPPRAVVYQFGEFISFIIDGHHKACAASILGKPLNCIVIIPFTGYRYRKFINKMVPDYLNFSSFTIPKKAIPRKYLPPIPELNENQYSINIMPGTINQRSWERIYIDSAKNYPSVTEYADIIAAGIPITQPIPDEWLASCLNDLNTENQRKIMAAIFVLENQKDPRLKHTAMICAKRLPYCELKKRAYKSLSTLKNDSDVEQLFIDYLIDCEDKHDPILRIVNLYFE